MPLVECAAARGFDLGLGERSNAELLLLENRGREARSVKAPAPHVFSELLPQSVEVPESLPGCLNRVRSASEARHIGRELAAPALVRLEKMRERPGLRVEESHRLLSTVVGRLVSGSEEGLERKRSLALQKGQVVVIRTPHEDLFVSYVDGGPVVRETLVQPARKKTDVPASEGVEVLVVGGPEAEVSPQVETEEEGVTRGSLEKQPRPARPALLAPFRGKERFEALGVRRGKDQDRIPRLDFRADDPLINRADLLELRGHPASLAFARVAHDAKMRAPDLD